MNFFVVRAAHRGRGARAERVRERDGGRHRSSGCAGARDARAGSERADADAGRSKEKKKRSKEPVVNRVKPPRPEKKVKVDMRFGSEADKKKLADERFDGVGFIEGH